MQIINPNFQINPNIKDERGYNIDLGVRTQSAKVILFDFSLFHLFYNNRIGTVWVTQNNVSSFPGINSSAPYFQIRTNVSEIDAIIFGILKSGNTPTRIYSFMY